MSALSLPANEKEFMLAVRGLPFSKRQGYATKLALQHVDDPQLLTLINELLSTSQLPATVPYPKKSESDPDEITLQFPQTTASKRFVERDLGLTMAVTVGKPALPIFLETLVHPSTTGRAKVIGPTVQFASDDVLHDLYNRCVPSVQAQLRVYIVQQARIDLMSRLHIKVPVPKSVDEPVISTLTRNLKESKESQRANIWGTTILNSIWPHKHARNPKYIAADSPLDLVETIFQLAEEFPPLRSSSPNVYKLADPIVAKCRSFLRHDLKRTLALIDKFCCQEKDTLQLPSTFMKGREAERFWHTLSLEEQHSTVEPFIAKLMERNQGTLLLNGKLHQANLVDELRWPVVYNLANKAMSFLKTTQDPKERQNVTRYILRAIELLHIRLSGVSRVDRDPKRKDQQSMDHGASEIITELVKRLLAALNATEQSDGAVINMLNSMVIGPIVSTCTEYKSLNRTLFNSVRGIFSMDQVSAELLQKIAPTLLRSLQPTIRTIYDIPDNGIVQPYSNLPQTENEDIFQLILSHWTPKRYLTYYAYSIVGLLSTAQKTHLWSYMDDVDWFVEVLLSPNGTTGPAINILRDVAPSPAARHPIVMAAIAKSEDPDTLPTLYGFVDLSDDAARSGLQKLTYKRLFDERQPVYAALIAATMASKNVRIFIDTMTFFIPRIKNEIPPDAAGLPHLFNENDVLHLLKQATPSEGDELSQLYLAWQKQNNEAVSVVPSITQHLSNIANNCMALSYAAPSGFLFDLAMQLLHNQYVNGHGVSQGRVLLVGALDTTREPARNEKEELAYRQFQTAPDKEVGVRGRWRIQKENEFVETFYNRLQEIFGVQSFERIPKYSSFVRTMLGCVGTRWTKVPRLVSYLEAQMASIREVAGTAEKPADWTSQSKISESINYVTAVRNLYRDDYVRENPLQVSWWDEIRGFRLLSTSSMQEVNARKAECVDKTGKEDPQKIDGLVEKLLQTHRTACYIWFVAQHLMDNRQDLLQDTYITEGARGLFHEVPINPDEPDKPVPPPDWNFTDGRRFFPHQCEVFASILERIIHSDESPLHARVAATEKFTRLPTTTIHELATLLKEDINPRISEAILMFLPRLDEPAAGVPFLLAPAILDSDLARTAVHSIRRALEHVPEAFVPALLEPVFISDGKVRPLKITVFKELVRVVSEFIRLPDMQELVKRLWNGRLHQDVRIALLQSVLPMLGSPQEEFAWTLIHDVVARENLLLDDTPLVLLAVSPAERVFHADGLQTVYLTRSPVLQDMATVTIPLALCDQYIKDVLWPMTKFEPQTDITSSLSPRAKADLKIRLDSIHREAYTLLYSQFLTPNNAGEFAAKAAQDLVEYDDGQDEQLFSYLVYAIARCISLDEKCWLHLVALIDRLAASVEAMGDDPSEKGLRDLNRLQSLNLSTAYMFSEPNDVRERVTHDRMSLVEPLKRHGISDLFATDILNRRLRLFKAIADKDKKLTAFVHDEARRLLVDVINLSRTMLLEWSLITPILKDLLASVNRYDQADLRAEVLAGQHGVLEAPWNDNIKLFVLQQTSEASPLFARQLDSYHREIATQKPAFYLAHTINIEKLIRVVLDEVFRKNPKVGTASPEQAFEILLPFLLEETESGYGEENILRNLFATYSGHFFRLLPDWCQKKGQVEFANAQNSPGRAVSFAKSLLSYVRQGHNNSTPYTCSLLAETLYHGQLSSLDFAKFADSGPQSLDAVTFPYFLSLDGNGGDIEDRASKATIAGLQRRYDTWKGTYASFFKKPTQVTATTYPSSVALKVVLGIYETVPRLTISDPALFLSCLCLSLSDPDLYSHSNTLIAALHRVLQPSREGDSGKKWGWLPPPGLALSFTQKMLTELPEEVSDAVIHGDFLIGPLKSKLEAVAMLNLWSNTFFDPSAGPAGFSPKHTQLLEVVKHEGIEELLARYDELRVLACKDGNSAVRAAAIKLRKARDLKVEQVTQG